MRDCKVASYSEEKADDAHDPESPRPPGSLRKEAGENGAEVEAAGRCGTEETEYHFLSPAWWVCPSEDGNCVREQKCRSNTLHGTTYIEEYGAFATASLDVDTEARHQAPESKPEEAGYEEAFMSVQISKSAGDQDECPDSKRICSWNPG